MNKLSDNSKPSTYHTRHQFNSNILVIYNHSYLLTKTAYDID